MGGILDVQPLRFPLGITGFSPLPNIPRIWQDSDVKNTHISFLGRFWTKIISQKWGLLNLNLLQSKFP